jgi:nucleotide-binding universal stress UspA family protein
MQEKILIPLDGSETGEAALPYVGKLISKMSSEIKVEVILLRVIARLTYYVASEEATVSIPYTEQEMAQIKKRANNYLKKAGEILKDKEITIKTQVVIGKPADEIIRSANEIDADLIAMSTHGRSGLSRWAFGSVTDRILRGGRRPVLVVRALKED